MNTLYKGLATLLITLAALMGCGGGGSSPATIATTTGKFVDATVVGIPYRCGTSTTTTGVTNASGEFTCPTGQSIAFYIGDILVGSAPSASAVLTPLDLVGAGATPSNTTVANIVRFLMSISSTDPATDTITITPAVLTAAAGKSINFATSTATDINTLITTVKPGATVYTAAQAAAHVGASIYGLFAGNYAGTFSGGDSGTWTVVINANGGVSGTLTFPGGGAAVTGAMSTTMSTGNTYGFTGLGNGIPWRGTLNVSTKAFSGTWGDASFGGTWTGKVR